MTKTILVFLPEGVADWEIAPVLSGARYFFNMNVRTIGIGADPVTSTGGLRIKPDTAIGDVDVLAADMLILPGSDAWQNQRFPAAEQAALRRAEAGRPVAAICGATLAVARAGLLDDRRHTSNGLEFLQKYAAGYGGADRYTQAFAVADGAMVTAPAAGPVSFAAEIFRLLVPSEGRTIDEFTGMFAAEHQPR